LFVITFLWQSSLRNHWTINNREFLRLLHKTQQEDNLANSSRGEHGFFKPVLKIDQFNKQEWCLFWARKTDKPVWYWLLLWWVFLYYNCLERELRAWAKSWSKRISRKRTRLVKTRFTNWVNCFHFVEFRIVECYLVIRLSWEQK
jgi:hypothetical protein